MRYKDFIKVIKHLQTKSGKYPTMSELLDYIASKK